MHPQDITSKPSRRCIALRTHTSSIGIYEQPKHTDDLLRVNDTIRLGALAIYSLYNDFSFSRFDDLVRLISGDNTPSTSESRRE